MEEFISSEYLKIVCAVKKEPVRLLAELTKFQSCKIRLGFLTLPNMFILEVIFYLFTFDLDQYEGQSSADWNHRNRTYQISG